MRVLVTGSRTWTDVGLIWQTLDGIWSNHQVAYETVTLDNLTIIHGAAKGADSAAGGWARGSPLHSAPFGHREYTGGPWVVE